MLRRFYLTLMVVLALSLTAFAGDVYHLDKAHTTIGFSVKHMVITTVPGKFKDFDGSITYDPKNPLATSAEVTIKTASINTGNEKRDGHLRSPDFFNAEKYPVITFKTNRIEKRNGQLVAIGDLTMRGVTKEIELPFTVSGPIVDPWGKTRIGIEASTTINRKDFGVSWNKALDSGGVVVSDEVKIKIHAEAVK